MASFKRPVKRPHPTQKHTKHLRMDRAKDYVKTDKKFVLHYLCHLKNVNNIETMNSGTVDKHAVLQFSCNDSLSLTNDIR